MKYDKIVKKMKRNVDRTQLRKRKVYMPMKE